MGEKLKIEWTLSDKLLEFLGWLGLFAFWYYLIVNYAKFPDIIPTHFDALGKADDYGSKSTIFILPIISSVLYTGLTILNKFPNIFNFPVKITEANILRQYTLAIKLIRVLKFVLVFVFSYLGYLSVSAVNGKDSLPSFTLPLILIAVFLPIGVYIYSAVKAKSGKQ